jgi:hypothetical protein
MQLMFLAVIIGAVLVYLLAVSVTHLIAAHLVLSLVIICLGVPALIAAMLAIIRGLSHHTPLIYSGPRELPRSMPAPAGIQAAPPPGKPADPFSADAPGAWEEMIDEADREELRRPGPREARVVSRPCEGPACGAALDGNPWEIEVDSGDGETERHAFCSRECTDAWKRQDTGSRTGKQQ